MQTQVDKHKAEFKFTNKTYFLEFNDKFQLISFSSKNNLKNTNCVRKEIINKYTENLTIQDIKYVLVIGYAAINFYSFFELKYKTSRFELKSLNFNIFKTYLFLNKINFKHLKIRIAKYSDLEILIKNFNDFKKYWYSDFKNKLKSIIIDNTLRGIFENISNNINYYFLPRVIRKYYNAFTVKFINNDIYVKFYPVLIDKLKSYGLQDILNIILSLGTWDSKHVKIENNYIVFKTKLFVEIVF